MAGVMVWNEDMRRAAMADAQKVCDLTNRVAQLEKAFAALIDAVEAKDRAKIERAMFVGRGLLF